MKKLPTYYLWTGSHFVPQPQGQTHQIVVADSWRVRDRKIWGLEDHVQRFLTGIETTKQLANQLVPPQPHALQAALQQVLVDTQRQHGATDLFPRISVETDGTTYWIILLVRPAPPIRSTTSLWIPEYTDPRTRPTVKGPDIDLMRRLVSEAPADDVVLHDGTNVVETTTGALLIWPTPQELVVCQSDQQLASISAQRIATYARSQNVMVHHRPVSLQDLGSGEYSVWFSNTLHGISPVTTISSVTGEKSVPVHPATGQWQTAWWNQFNAVRTSKITE